MQVEGVFFKRKRSYGLHEEDVLSLQIRGGKIFVLLQMEDISLYKVKTSACQREEQLRKRKNGGTQ